jgi:SAM-dependent methyltransferase
MLSPDELRKYNVFNTTQERDFYIRASYGRNVKTVETVKNLGPKSIFEFGANPYFMTVMIEDEVRPSWYCKANWFSEDFMDPGVFEGTQQAGDKEFHFQHFNVEDMDSPCWKEVGSDYDVILFCEILEHLLVDPAPLMDRLKGMLRPGGSLMLTTPNVFSRHNQTLWQAGQNIYEWYSPNGPYGRHNRVWSGAEIRHFATNVWGFKAAQLFTHDAGLPAAATHVDYTDQTGDTIFAVLRKPE